jgi:predicted methyltransferase
LGYTALAAARRGAAVTTIELDDAMQAMCLANPYSRMDASVGAIPSSKGTFGAAPGASVAASGSVTQLRGCAAALVAALPDASFDRILHDPPTFALAGALFSADFYAQLARILAPKVRARAGVAWRRVRLRAMRGRDMRCGRCGCVCADVRCALRCVRVLAWAAHRASCITTSEARARPHAAAGRGHIRVMAVPFHSF